MRDADVVNFTEWPPETTRLAWCAWLERHGIDPKLVAVPGTISRSISERTIRYEAFKRDERDGGLRLARETVVVALDREPEPFPQTDDESETSDV